MYVTGKVASVSHAPSLSLGLDQDVFKFSDIISTWSPRSIVEEEKENDRESSREKPKHENAKKRAANKENDGVKREESFKLERRTSKSGHSRAQSQPKILLAEGEYA